MVKGFVCSLLLSFRISFVISDAELSFNCTDTTEEFCQGTSLLQVSVAHTEPGYPGRSVKRDKGFVDQLVVQAHKERYLKGLYQWDPWQTDTCTAISIVFVLGNSYWGWSMRGAGKETVPNWIVVMLVISYMAFIIGLFGSNVSWYILESKEGALDLISPAVSGTPDKLITFLLSTSSWPHLAGLVFLMFVVCNPMAKLFLLIAAKLLESNDTAVSTARKFVFAIRISAKWASPLHLVILAYHCECLHVKYPLGLTVTTVLQVGWIGFTLFCVTNLISALALPMPNLPREPRPRSLELSGRCKVFMLVIVTLSALLYGTLLMLGASSPLYRVNWKMWGQFEGVSEDITKETAQISMSLVRCFEVLIEGFCQSRHMTALVASLVLLFGTVVLAIADMSALTLCAYCTYMGDDKAFTFWISVSRVIRHCAMVDVLVVGMWLAELSNFFSIEIGVFQLFLAELVRYLITYMIIENAAWAIEFKMDLSRSHQDGQTRLLIPFHGVNVSQKRDLRPLRADQSESDTSSIPRQVRGVIRVDDKKLDESDSDVPVEVMHFDDKTNQDSQVALPVALPKQCSDDIRWDLQGSRGGQAAMIA